MKPESLLYCRPPPPPRGGPPKTCPGGGLDAFGIFIVHAIHYTQLGELSCVQKKKKMQGYVRKQFAYKLNSL